MASALVLQNGRRHGIRSKSCPCARNRSSNMDGSPPSPPFNPLLAPSLSLLQPRSSFGIAPHGHKSLIIPVESGDFPRNGFDSPASLYSSECIATSALQSMGAMPNPILDGSCGPAFAVMPASPSSESNLTTTSTTTLASPLLTAASPPVVLPMMGCAAILSNIVVAITTAKNLSFAASDHLFLKLQAREWSQTLPAVRPRPLAGNVYGLWRKPFSSASSAGQPGGWSVPLQPILQGDECFPQRWGERVDIELWVRPRGAGQPDRKLSEMVLDLHSIPIGTVAQPRVDFGFGVLTATMTTMMTKCDLGSDPIAETKWPLGPLRRLIRCLFPEQTAQPVKDESLDSTTSCQSFVLANLRGHWWGSRRARHDNNTSEARSAIEAWVA